MAEHAPFTVGSLGVGGGRPGWRATHEYDRVDEGNRQGFTGCARDSA
ncbi:hypothetical protein [Halorientalis brevis]